MRKECLFGKDTASFEVLSQNSPKITEENHEKSQSIKSE
jgi:hypothetical protein